MSSKFEPLSKAQAAAAYFALSPEGRNLVDALVGRIGISRVSVGFFEMVTSLVYRKVINPGSLVFSIPVLPGAIVQVVQPVAQGQVVAAGQSLITISADHMLQYTLNQDGNVIYTDIDMIEDNYRQPINFYSIESPLYIRKQLIDTFTNVGYVPVNVQEVNLFGTIVSDQFDEIIGGYYDTIFENIAGRKV